MKFSGELCGKLNKPCFWADVKGQCSWHAHGCETVIEKCEGCDHIQEIESEEYCSIFACPRGQWNYGKCQWNTHLVEKTIDPRKARNRMLNPLKSSKRKHGQ